MFDFSAISASATATPPSDTLWQAVIQPALIASRMKSPVRFSAFRSTGGGGPSRSEEHTSELQSLMRISYAVFCLKKKKHTKKNQTISSARNRTRNEITDTAIVNT